MNSPVWFFAQRGYYNSLAFESRQRLQVILDYWDNTGRPCVVVFKVKLKK